MEFSGERGVGGIIGFYGKRERYLWGKEGGFERKGGISGRYAGKLRFLGKEGGFLLKNGFSWVFGQEIGKK